MAFFRFTERTIGGGRQGFQIEFANGWKISVQFGLSDHCANWDAAFPTPSVVGQCEDAEIAIIHKSGAWPDFADTGEGIKGWVKPDDVLKYMMWASRLADHPDAAEGVVPKLD